jgi:uncharacterized protein (DUF2249 family)
MTEENFLELDVRPIVAARRPPMSDILAAVDRLAPGQALRLLAPFEPSPLYTLLGKRGFSHETSRADDGAWVIVFRP